ncbi:hypothetical protein AVEN_101636-1 [Araneus ventricosus]|uniref:Uncharacterized protein n=1 Tax=Araneus ventricosus TaxID=182803 RepID=A0A4Y2EXQ4_ARAVE|nr:hypothetical protein AVEN_101636-1 [Araneus ventricosus]
MPRWHSGKGLDFGVGGFQVRSPIPLKIRHVLGLLHVKSCVGVKRPPVGVVQKYPHRCGLPKKGARPGESRPTSMWRAGFIRYDTGIARTRAVLLKA